MPARRIFSAPIFYVAFLNCSSRARSRWCTGRISSTVMAGGMTAASTKSAGDVRPSYRSARRASHGYTLGELQIQLLTRTNSASCLCKRPDRPGAAFKGGHQGGPPAEVSDRAGHSLRAPVRGYHQPEQPGHHETGAPDCQGGWQG